MEISMQLTGSNDDEAELRSLRDWLSGDHELPVTSLELETPKIADREMGALADTLIVAFGSGGTGAVLARSLSVWFQTRTTDLKIKLKTSKGSLEIDGNRLRRPEELFNEINRIIESSSDDPA